MADVTDTLLYLRMSMDRTGEELGISRQREDGELLAKAKRLRIVREIVDNDVSSSGKRVVPGFEQLLAMLEAGEARCVIAWNMYRLTRNARDRIRLLEVGKRHGVILSFCRGSDIDLSTPSGRLMAGILGEVAQHEIDEKADRQQRAARQAAEMGRRKGGRRPFGYEADGMTVRPDEATAVRDGFEQLLGGVALGRIAASWNERGLFTPQAGYAHGCDGRCEPGIRPRQCPDRRASDEPSRWSSQTVRPVLLNPRYAGLRSYVPQASRERREDPRLARVAGVVGEALWPALVSEATWRAAVDVLTDASRTRRPRSAKGLLTGVGLCGVCGSTVHRGGAIAASRAGYRCSGSLGHVARDAEPVDWFVGEAVVGLLGQPDAAKLLVDERRPDARALADEARELRRQLDGLAGLFSDGVLTENSVRRESEKLRGRLAEVEVEQSDAGRVDVLGPLVRAADVRATWEALDVDRKRAVIALLLIVTVRPPGRGVRLGRSPAEWQQNAARIAATVGIERRNLEV